MKKSFMMGTTQVRGLKIVTMVREVGESSHHSDLWGGHGKVLIFYEVNERC